MTGRAAAILRATWWVLWPSFVALAVSLSVARSCGDPYDPLPGLSRHPSQGWPIAIVYVLTHVWMVSAYLRTAIAADTLLPPLAAWRHEWDRDLLKVVLMLLALAIEYAPMTLWKLASAACGNG